jgi:hypothetical protein
MDGPAAFLAVRWMIYDTARQAWSSGLIAALATVSAVCIALCLSVRVEDDIDLSTAGPDRPELLPRSDVRAASRAVAGVVLVGAGVSRGVWGVPPAWASREYRQVELALRDRVEIARGRMTLAFGALPVEISRDRHHAVRSLQGVLAGLVADAGGVMLALVWTAGFLPTFLDPRASAVLLAKPVPRCTVLIGKYLGVVTVVAAMALLFVGGTWLALGLRTGVWGADYYHCLPVLVAHFAIFYAVSTLLAVTTRNTALCLTGALAFWLLCWGANAARHAAVAGGASAGVMEGLYWVLPKPLDFHVLLTQALRAEDFLTQAIDLRGVQEHGGWSPEAALLTSLAAGAAALAAAVWRFQRSDA